MHEVKSLEIPHNGRFLHHIGRVSSANISTGIKLNNRFN